MGPIKSIEFAAGMFLLLGLLGLGFMANEATDYSENMHSDFYRVSARFTNIGDLKPRAPVTVSGVTVGSVDFVELDDVTFEAVAHLKINSEFNQMPDDTAAKILTSGILGDQYVGLEPGGSPDYLADGDEITMTQSAIVIEELIGKYMFDSGADEDQKP